DPIMAETNFLTFAGTSSSGGDVEHTPHNHVHSTIGGDMGAYMSPLDPIFWTHHNKCDEMWMEWSILKDNPNTNASAWTSAEFTDFFDEDGNAVTTPLIATTIMPLISYRFDTQL